VLAYMGLCKLKKSLFNNFDIANKNLVC